MTVLRCGMISAEGPSLKVSPRSGSRELPARRVTLHQVGARNCLREMPSLAGSGRGPKLVREPPGISSGDALNSQNWSKRSPESGAAERLRIGPGDAQNWSGSNWSGRRSELVRDQLVWETPRIGSEAAFRNARIGPGRGWETPKLVWDTLRSPGHAGSKLVWAVPLTWLGDPEDVWKIARIGP